MKQLAARDAAYLYLDDGHISATVVSCWVLSHGRENTPAVSRTDLIERLGECVAAEPLFASRLVRLPLDIGLPYWKLDPGFDVAQHVSEHSADLTWSDAQQLLTEMSSRPFDYAKPLWRAQLLTHVTGMPDHHGPATIVAVMFHHAAFDGVTWAALTRAVLADHDATPTPVEPSPATGARDPSLARLTVDNTVRAPWRWLRFLAALLSPRKKPVASDQISADRVPAAARTATPSWPRTRFTTPFVGPRHVDYCVLALSDIKAARHTVPGATVNDVVLAILGRALHIFLTDLGEPPQTSLSALVPMSTRTATGGPANQFAPTVIDMHTTEADPARRLAAIATSTADAKAHNARKTPKQNIVHVTPAPLMRALGALARRGDSKPPATVFANTVVANVYTAQPLDSMFGHVVHAAFGIQPLGLPATLAHSVSSIGDRLAISITSDSATLHDTSGYTALICQTLDDYV